MKINILYFASLRDRTHKATEAVEINCKNVNEIYDKLNSKYNFMINKEDIRVAVNDTYVDFDYLLQDNDTLIFIPPVSGG